MHDIFKEGSFFKGRIIRVEPSLEAFFVDYGAERAGFIPFFRIEGFDKTIHNEGYVLSVCIDKPERGMKGASLYAPQQIPEGSIVHELPLDKPIHQPLKKEKTSLRNFVWLLVAFVLIAIVTLNT
jgi:hypothetical protein